MALKTKVVKVIDGLSLLEDTQGREAPLFRRHPKTTEGSSHGSRVLSTLPPSRPTPVARGPHGGLAFPVILPKSSYPAR